MSSMEIAKLTGKRHDNVMADIRKILNEVGIDESKFAASYFNSQNKKLPCFNLPRREYDLVIGGYSTKHRLAAIQLADEQAEAAKQEAIRAKMQAEVEAERQAADIEELRKQVKQKQAEAAAVVNAACPPKPKQAKPKQAESASRIGSNPLPHVGVISLVVRDSNVSTMSSMEIAKLTGKRHDNVMVDIRKMLVELYGEAGCPEFSGVYKDQQLIDRQCFNLPKRETDILVSGYSITMRAKIVDRWQELEQKVAQPQFAIPQTYHEALRLSADLAEKNAVITGQLAIASEQLSITSGQLAITAPKANVLDQIATADGSICISNAAKLVGLSRDDAFSWLYNHGWIFRRGGVGSWVAMDDKRVQGLLEMKVSTIEIGTDGREMIVEGVRMTPKCFFI